MPPPPHFPPSQRTMRVPRGTFLWEQVHRWVATAPKLPPPAYLGCPSLAKRHGDGCLGVTSQNPQVLRNNARLWRPH